MTVTSSPKHLPFAIIEVLVNGVIEGIFPVFDTWALGCLALLRDELIPYVVPSLLFSF